MNFKQRLLRYGLGLAIGCVVVFFMFPQYDWLGWTPGKRVMENIREARFDISPHGQCKMDCMGINMDQLQLARNEGKVDFKKSDVKAAPKLYHLDYGNITLKIALTDTTALLTDAMKDGITCDCH